MQKVLVFGALPFKCLVAHFFPQNCKFDQDDLLCLFRPQNYIWCLDDLGELQPSPRSTFMSHDWAFCSKLFLVVAVVGGFSPALKNLIDGVFPVGISTTGQYRNSIKLCAWEWAVRGASDVRVHIPDGLWKDGRGPASPSSPECQCV